MNDITNICQLEWHGNMNTFEFHDKYIILYDDHRYVLNVLYEAIRQNVFNGVIPNVVFFDHHDDSLPTNIELKKYKISNILEMNRRDFWNLVEFDVREWDDDWVTVGMELGLIKDVLCIGQEKNKNIKLWDNNTYVDKCEICHKGYVIGHLIDELKPDGKLGKNTNESKSIGDVLDYYDKGFLANKTKPFILDFDLDCFTTQENNEPKAWTEEKFNCFYCNQDVKYFIFSLIDRASIVTICREPKCCGGIGESNKILGYLDKYFFDGKLTTEPK